MYILIDMVRRRDRTYLPMSTAGIIRYTDVESRGPRLKPEHVIYATIGLIIFVIMLKLGLII